MQPPVQQRFDHSAPQGSGAAAPFPRDPSYTDVAQFHTDAPTGVAVRARGLTRRFGSRTVIDALNLDIAPGEFVALIGRSGCGKSTLLRILANLDDDIEGEVIVPERRAVAFQSPRLMPWLRVWRNVAMGKSGPVDRRHAEAALSEVGLAHRGGAWPSVLSGGEAQRAALARALIREPDLLLLDEPFGALDALTRVNAQRLVSRLWRVHGCAVLLITHDVDEALLLADRVLVMAEGRIVEAVTVETAVETAVDTSVDTAMDTAMDTAVDPAVDPAVDLARGYHPKGNAVGDAGAEGAVRDTTSVRFGQLRRRLLSALGVEDDPHAPDSHARGLSAFATSPAVAQATLSPSAAA